MANIYVRSGAGGAATGADWANACLTLTAGITASAVGDDIWVSEDHAESTASAITLAFKGTVASPNRVLCVDHTGTVPPVAADLRTTATVSTTGASNIAISGFAWIRGIGFLAGSSTNIASITFGASVASALVLELCGLTLNNSNNSSRITLGSTAVSPSYHRFVNTVPTFGSTSQAVNPGVCKFDWESTPTAIGGATFPTTFMTMAGAGFVRLVGVDLSALTGTLFSTGSGHNATYVIQDCKINGSATIASTPSSYGSEIFVNRIASSGIAYTQNKYTYSGTETMETTIVRTGGGTVNGTAVSKKYVTTANCKWQQPFVASPIAVGNSTTGTNRVVTVYGIWGGGAVPNNDDIWFDVFYLGASGSPQASIATCGKASILATSTALSSDSSTWGGSTTKFKMAVTLNSPQPQLAGEMYIRIYCGAASATFYVDAFGAELS